MTLDRYLGEVRRSARMTPERERALALRYRRNKDPVARSRLAAANLPLVVRLARRYTHGSRLVLLDVIQEGNLGLLRAIDKFDPNRGFRLSTYVTWWVRAYILRYLMLNARLVRVGTSEKQRRLFYNLAKEKLRFERLGRIADADALAVALRASPEEVRDMEARLQATETSLDATADGRPGEGGPTRLSLLAAPDRDRPDRQAETDEIIGRTRSVLASVAGQLTRRDRVILRRRMMADEPESLGALGARFRVTRERVRQIEVSLRQRLRGPLQEVAPC